MPRSLPVVLDIPAIGVHTRLMPLGLNPDRTVEVPPDPLLAGWYRYEPTPGEIGPAVILGHVDSRTVGPGVFFRLGTLRPGALIQVRRHNGTVARFSVRAVRTYPKTAFPTRDVYGNTQAPELRLVTCGDWDTRTRIYRGNTIVFAALSP
jgi:sortase (surface protein transpeptidase)